MAEVAGSSPVRGLHSNRGVPEVEDGPILGIGERKLVRVRVSLPRPIFYLTQIQNYAMISSWQKDNAE